MAHQSELDKLQRRYEEKPSQWFAALAEEHRRAGDVQRALEIVRQGLEQRSNYVSGHIVLARCLLDRGEDEEAQQVLERVLELDPENVIALKVLSEIAERGGDPTAARSWLERLLEVDPMNEEGQQLLERLAEAPEAAPSDSPPPSDLPALETEGAVDAVEAGEAGEAVEVVESVGLEEAGGAAEAVEAAEPPVLLDSTVPEPAIEAADVAAPDAVKPPPLVLDSFDASAAEAPSDPIELVEEGGGQEPAPAFEIERTGEMPAIDDQVQGESVPAPEAEITGANVEHDTPLELSSDGGDGPPPDGIVGAEVDRPDPIELAGGPGMVVGSDQATELVGSGESSSEDLDAGDRSPLDTEQPPIELEEPVPAEALEPASAVEEPEAPPPSPSPSPSPSAPTQDPEPVVTETMAEVYVKQGLVDEALNVYRALLARRPTDPELLDRIAELETQAAPAASAADEGPRYRASETGGGSARALLAQVLAAGGGDMTAQAPPAISEGPTPLESAFNTPDASDTPGAPTQSAPDAASLGSVFGEEPPAPPLSPSPTPGEQGAGSGEQSGVSFDEFFGGSGGDQASPEPKESSGEGEQPKPEEDDFKDWLKGLKS